MSILLYGLESSQLTNADLFSLDFTFSRLFMKLFKTKSIDVLEVVNIHFSIFFFLFVYHSMVQ